MANEIDLRGLDKAEVLAALYNRARPQGMGFLHFTPELMTAVDARAFLAADTYFDYVRGRVMKVDLGGDTLHTALYDRDNGEGAAASVIAALRAAGAP